MSDFIVKIFLNVAVGCSRAGGKKGKLFCGFWSVRWPRATHKCAYPCALGYFLLRKAYSKAQFVTTFSQLPISFLQFVTSKTQFVISFSQLATSKLQFVISFSQLAISKLQLPC